MSYTVRIDRANGDREVLGCRRYRVLAGGASVVLQQALTSEDETVALAPGDRGYVMNERGTTVDQIVSPRRVPA